MKASLFITTYEMPRHLELVLEGVQRQSSREFEVLICNDGSSDPTTQVIDHFTRTSGISTQHLWQEHQGFRKCKILNKALERAQGEIAIFLDGDCIPHRHYVRDHIENQEKGYYLAGRRVELGQKLSAALSVDQIKNGFFDFAHPKLFWSVIQGDSEYFNRSFRISSKYLRKLFKMDRVVDLKGCNYSVPREALEEINGFDEAYEGYGREDTDVELRLQNLGLKIKSLKGLALQYHVWHPRREFTPANDTRLEEIKKSGRIRCEKGLKPSQNP